MTPDPATVAAAAERYRANIYSYDNRGLISLGQPRYDDMKILADYALATLAAPVVPEDVFTDEECFNLNAHQHNSQRHPYTCGNDSQNHRPLIATPQGWRCADCDYKQNWAGEIMKKIGGQR